MKYVNNEMSAYKSLNRVVKTKFDKNMYTDGINFFIFSTRDKIILSSLRALRSISVVVPMLLGRVMGRNAEETLGYFVIMCFLSFPLERKVVSFFAERFLKRTSVPKNEIKRINESMAVK